LRWREPDAPRPFRALGYPIAPAIFVIAMMLIVCNALWRDLVVPVMRDQPWGPSAAGLIVIGLGLPLYYLLGTRASAGQQRV
jgi:APA family basic amino acid/polyamine antiporter